MPKKPMIKPIPPDNRTPMERMTHFAKALLSVPKADIDKALAREKKAKKRKR